MEEKREAAAAPPAEIAEGIRWASGGPGAPPTAAPGVENRASGRCSVCGGEVEEGSRLMISRTAEPDRGPVCGSCYDETPDDQRFELAAPISLPPIELEARDAGNVAPGEPHVKYLDAETFRSEGYLQEANRGFFHPLGLALELIFGAPANRAVLRVWDYRHDPEGIRFEGCDLAPHVTHIAELREARRPARQAALGYWQQPAGEKARYSPPVLTEFTSFTNIGGELLCSRCKADFDFVDWTSELTDEDDIDYPAFCPKCGRPRAPEFNALLPAGNTSLPEGGLPTAADLDAVEAERKLAGQS